MANIVTNKNLIPGDTPQDWDTPGGLRLGTIEVTRYGMREAEMTTIAEFMARVLVQKESPDTVVEDVIEFRQGYQTLYFTTTSIMVCHGMEQSLISQCLKTTDL